MKEFVPWKGTILKGHESSSNHQFSRDMLIFGGVVQLMFFDPPDIWGHWIWILFPPKGVWPRKHWQFDVFPLGPA